MSGGPLAPAPAPAAAPPTARLRVGVIGLGMGRGHIVGWREHPQVDAVALADPDSARLTLIGNEFGIAALYASAKAMLATEALDVMSVCARPTGCICRSPWPLLRPAAMCCARSRWR